LGLGGMFFTFGAPILLPLAVATTFGFTTPIFAVILSALLLGEKIGPVRWLAVVLGFAGVVIIAQPGHAAIPLFGAFVGIGAGFMVALISIQVRDLGRTEESLSIVFWFSALSAPILAIVLPFYATAHTPWQWFLLISCGLLGLLGQLLLTAALRYGQVASVIVMDYSALVWATVYGWLIWDELPPAATWLGAPAIIAAGAVTSSPQPRPVARARRSRTASQDSKPTGPAMKVAARNGSWARREKPFASASRAIHSPVNRSKAR